ncbi:hypothetical protein SASC598J21_014820, partial [Snodgrassella alvi SCGC AB-598-J21]
MATEINFTVQSLIMYCSFYERINKREYYIKYFGICLLAYLPLSALAAQTSSIASEWDLRMECSNSTPSEAEMTRCLKAKALKSQKELQNPEKK